MDVLKLFVLVFFGSFLFGVIPGAWSPGVTTKQSISVSSRITNSAPCVSPHISRLPSHSPGVLCEFVSLFFLQFMLKRPSGPLPSTSSSTLSGSGYSSRSTRTPDVLASCADVVTSYVCFKCSFLWSSIIASVIFAVVDFFSAKASRSPRSWCRWWCPGWCSGRFWFATDISMP